MSREGESWKIEAFAIVMTEVYGRAVSNCRVPSNNTVERDRQKHEVGIAAMESYGRCVASGRITPNLTRKDVEGDTL